MDLAKAVDHVRPSIVQIVFHASDLSEDMRRLLGRIFVSQPLGTGFIVNSDGYVITARHVIEDGLIKVSNFPAKTKQLFVGFANPNTENMRGNFTLVPFEVFDQDELHDIALLKLKANPFKGEVKSLVGGIPLVLGVASLNAERPEDGVAVGISGYPLGQSVLVTNGGFMATSWAFDLQEVTVPGVPEWFRKLEVADSYLADVNANPGNSGGPVYLADDGSVIGICVRLLGTKVWDDQGSRELYYSSGLTVVVPIRYAVDLLKKRGLTWIEAKK